MADFNISRQKNHFDLLSREADLSMPRPPVFGAVSPVTPP